MKILFLANDDEGLYKFRKELISTLIKDNEVYISLPYGKYVDDLVSLGSKFIDTTFNRKGTNPFKDFKLILFYKKIIKEIKPDVVLTYTVKPNVYGGIACQLTKTPYVANITGISSAIEKGGLIGFIVLTLYRLGLRKANKVFFQNKVNEQYMIDKKVVKNNNDLLPGSGVNLDEYKIMDYPDDEIINFVYIARIMKEKGFEQYIETAKYIRNKYPNTMFHVCGTYDEEEYKPIVEELMNKNIINYHGSVSDMKEIYQMIHCTIHASYYAEGLSNALLETLACARPIITTNRPGCGELVIDGEDGYLIKQQDTNDLILKVEKLLSLDNKQRKMMGLAGRKLVEEKYSREIVINKYLDAIKEITNG